MGCIISYMYVIHGNARSGSGIETLKLAEHDPMVLEIAVYEDTIHV